MTAPAARWYQSEAKEAFFQYFYSSNGNPIIALPTGAGKSFVQADILQTILHNWPHQRIMCLTHVQELVSQNARQMHRLWSQAPLGIYSAGLKQRDLHYPITFGTIGSVDKIVPAFGHIDLLFIDEAHMLGESESAMYMRTIGELKRRNPYLKIIGFTATPWRTKMGLLTNGPIFTDIIYNLCTMEGFARLFDDNFLVPPRAKKTTIEYDVSKVKTTGDDYAKGELNAVTRDETITWAAIQESLKKGEERNCRLTFTTSIEHALMATEMLRACGVNAYAVHSKMPPRDRTDMLKAYFAGEFDTLVNMGIATTGIDHPPIDHIIMLRPTQSVGLWNQMLGRGMRPFELNGWHKLDCLVTDHGGNCQRLGTIDDPYIPKQATKGKGDAPVKICPACGCYNHAAARSCAECGEPFEQRIGYTKEASEEPLVRSDLPLYETFEVDHVYYTQYLKKGATASDLPTLKATYACGLKTFTEYVAFEHGGFAAKRARLWWKQRFPQEGFVPKTVNEAAQFIDRLAKPKTIKVWTNRRMPEIVEHGF